VIRRAWWIWRISLVGLIVAGTWTVRAEIAGWNRDGTGNYPDANPPIEFDGATGRNVKWKTKLPNWSNSSPILVQPSCAKASEGKPEAGGHARIFCTAEPLECAPLLLCIDAETGTELWRRELDPIPALDADEKTRQALRADWQRLHHLVRETRAIAGMGRALYRREPAAWKSATEIPGWAVDEFKALLARAEAIGATATPWKGKSQGNLMKTYVLQPAELDSLYKTLRTRGLVLDGWWDSGTWTGQAYPTPVSDGRHVYTVTYSQLYSCHDMDGTLLWSRHFLPPDPKQFRPELIERTNIKRPSWPFDWGSNHASTSPLLIPDASIGSGLVLVTALGDVLRALDAKTGATLWQLPMRGGYMHTMGLPGVATVDGRHYLITPEGHYRPVNSNEIVRVSDGTVVGELPGQVTGKAIALGQGIVLQDGTVVNVDTGQNKKGEVVGWTLSARPDGRIEAKERWRISSRQGPDLDRPAWRGMEIVGGAVRFDGAGGKVLNETMRSGVQGADRENTCRILAGPYYVQCSNLGHIGFWDIASGKKVGAGMVPVNPADGASAEWKVSQEGVPFSGGEDDNPGWRCMSNATPVAHKNRLYVRSYDFLWCFEARE
jgi:outer membrane protein assembly factor BamB